MKKRKEKAVKFKLNIFEMILVVLSILSISLLLLVITLFTLFDDSVVTLLYLTYFNVVQIFVTIFIFIASIYEFVDLNRLKNFKKANKSKIYINRLLFLAISFIVSSILSIIICASFFSINASPQTCSGAGCEAPVMGLLQVVMIVPMIIATLSTLLVHCPFLVGCFLADKHYCKKVNFENATKAQITKEL